MTIEVTTWDYSLEYFYLYVQLTNHSLDVLRTTVRKYFSYLLPDPQSYLEIAKKATLCFSQICDIYASL